MTKKTDLYLFKMLSPKKFNPSEILDPGEYESYLAMASEKRKTEFLNSRFLVRSVFEDLYGLKSVSLKLSCNGKPSVKGWKFNLSHSGDRIVLAVHKKAEVGVDIEMKKSQKHFIEIAEQYFSATELRYILCSASQPRRLQKFKNLWSLKESYIKAFDGILNKRSIKIHFDLGRKVVEKAPTRKQLSFFLNEEFNIALCVTDQMSVADLAVQEIQLAKNKGLITKKMNLKFIQMRWPRSAQGK